MTTVSHNVNFSQSCEAGGSGDSGSGTIAGFESTLEISPDSPPQQVAPCPDTILNYTSNISGGITVTAKYGSASVDSVVTDEFTKSWAITAAGESAVPFQYQSITITDWQPLLFNGEACGSSGGGHGAVSIADGIVTATSPGVITVKAVVTVFVITVTLEPPTDSVGTWKELVVVCQSGHATALEFEYDDCISRAALTPCCQRFDKSSPFILGPGSMGTTSSAGVSVGGGCPPYSWFVLGSAILAGNNKKHNPDGTTSHDENDNTNILETNDACTPIFVSVTDGCGNSATKEIEIDGCCSSFMLSLDCDGFPCDGFFDMHRGETRAMRLLTSGEGQTIVWPEGGDKISIGTASPDYKGRLYYVTADGDCDGPFRFGIIDNCNPSSVMYFDGSLVDAGPCCPPEESTEWDGDNSADTITQSGLATVAVKGSLATRNDFSWTVSGTGYTFSNGKMVITGGSSQIIYASASSCGSCEIGVTDACGDIISGTIRNTDNGYWYRYCYLDCYDHQEIFTLPINHSGLVPTATLVQTITSGKFRVMYRSEQLSHVVPPWYVSSCSDAKNFQNASKENVYNLGVAWGFDVQTWGIQSVILASPHPFTQSEDCLYCSHANIYCGYDEDYYAIGINPKFVDEWKCNP